MSSTQQLSITLPSEMVAMVRAKVASGEYANDSEVILDGLEFLRERERGFEHWLRTKAELSLADPRPGVAHAEVMAEMDALIDDIEAEQRN
ncbi:MAG: type II toxin-antitoxin system ParD family antitoxin [Pseudomonadales bacterium]|jgi:putative addiction module CopG family antidote|nr:type II toxin-antitoxin system ParD family antitoxin [Pseudomonadales bacterium]